MNYKPHPWHLFFFPTVTFSLGVLCFRKNVDDLGWMLLALGVVITFVICWALIWDVFVRKAQSIQYLFDSARYLNDEMVDRILYAMGLSIKTQAPSSNITITRVNTAGRFEGLTTYHDIPATPEQLQALAIGTLNEQAPFSRPEWVDRRSVFSDTKFRTLKTYLWEKKLIDLVNTQNVNDGYRFNSTGREVLQGYLPSPTPQPEMA